MSLFLVNCQKDESHLGAESSDELQDIIRRKISINEIPNLNLVNEKLSTIQKNLKFKTSTDFLAREFDADSATILTDEILYATYENTHTLTFKVVRNNPEYYIENIVLHYNLEAENYDEFFVQYNISSQEYLDFSNGIPLPEDTNVIMEKLDNGTFSGLVSRGFCNTTCASFNFNCTAGGNHEFGDTTCVGNSDQQPFQIQICNTTCYYTYQNNSIDEPDGPGGGGGGGTTTTTIVTNPNPVEPCETSTNGNTDTGVTGIDGDCLDVDNDNEMNFYNDLTVDEKNCDELQKLFEIPNYPIPQPFKSPKDAIIHLKGLISPNIDQNNDREKGYNLVHTSNQDAYASWIPNTNTSSKSVRYRFTPNNYGGLHLHPNDGKGHPFFSPEDILNLWRFSSTYNNGTAVDPSLFMHVLVSTKGVYAIKIDNPLIFGQLAAIYLDNKDANQDGTDEVEEFSRPLENAYKRFIDYASGYPTGSDTDYQRAFLKFMNNFDGDGTKIGISLYKADANLTSWSKLTLNETTNIITPTPCD